MPSLRLGIVAVLVLRSVSALAQTSAPSHKVLPVEHGFVGVTFNFNDIHGYSSSGGGCCNVRRAAIVAGPGGRLQAGLEFTPLGSTSRSIHAGELVKLFTDTQTERQRIWLMLLRVRVATVKRMSIHAAGGVGLRTALFDDVLLVGTPPVQSRTGGHSKSLAMSVGGDVEYRVIRFASLAFEGRYYRLQPIATVLRPSAVDLPTFGFSFRGVW